MAFIKNESNWTQINKWIWVIAVLVSLPLATVGQIIYSNTFTGTGTCPTQGNTPVMSSNATGSPLSRSKVTCASSANVFNSETINNTASVDNASYLEFSVTPSTSAQLNVTSLSFFRQASATAPNQLEVRYSTDGFATSTSWGAAPVTPTTGSSVTWDFADFSVPPGTTLTFRLYPYGTQRADLGTGASNGTVGTFRVDDVVLNGASPLPVNLVSFTGKSGQNGVTIQWVTAWEEENQGFDVQKSTNAKSFERIGTVAGKYTTQVQSVYEFTDQNVTPGQVYYYRLKQNDRGGESSLSQIIAVLADARAQADNGSIFPNPNKGNFSLTGLAFVPADVKLYAPSGVEMPIATEDIQGRNALDIWARTFLPPGIYYLHVNPKDGSETKAFKVLVEP